MGSLRDPDVNYGDVGRAKLARPPFATKENLESAAVYLQSSLKSFGFSGRVNFLSNTPEDIANTFNCVYYLLEKFQREQGRNEDTSSEVKRLRNELQVGENVCGRLKKDLEMRERDIGTMMIKERQSQSAYQEQIAIITRDKETLQKKCNNLSRRQVQFQHEIRRKEVEYQRLQDKLRYYLAEKKREAKASMEIVGRLRQQSQTTGRGGLLNDDLLKNARGGSAKLGRANGKLDENLVKMIVRAYEDKQRELTMENSDLTGALNSLQREYAQLLNARMGGPNVVPQYLRGGIVPVSNPETQAQMVEPTSGPLGPTSLKINNSDTLAASTLSVTPRGTESDILARTPSARTPCTSARSSPRDRADMNSNLVVPKAEDIAAAIKRRSDLEIIPSGTSESQANADNLSSQHEESDEDLEPEPSEKSCPEESFDECRVTNPSISSVEKEEITSNDESEMQPLNKTKPLPTLKPRAFHGSFAYDLPELRSTAQSNQMSTSPFATNMSEGVSARAAKFCWPPPSTSPQPGAQSQGRHRVMGKLGKLPGISKKPLPNSSMMTEEQLKQELRVRAQEVEEAVLALRGACGSMNPQDMRGVLEKRLHMELVMAANLAEQQEAIVNLALIGMEKALRHVGSGELKEDNDDEREKLMIYQLEKLCINLSDLIAQVPSEYVEDSLRGVVTEIDEKAALAREEYEDVKEDLIMAQKKIRKLQRSLESSGKILNDNLTSIDKRSAKLAHEEEYLSQLRREFVRQGDGSSPVADILGPKKIRQTWAEKAQNTADTPDPFDELPEDCVTPSKTEKTSSPGPESPAVKTT